MQKPKNKKIKKYFKPFLKPKANDLAIVIQIKIATLMVEL